MSKRTINYNNMQSIYLNYLFFNIQLGKLWNGLEKVIHDMVYDAHVKNVRNELIGQKNICNDIEKNKKYDYYIDICNERLKDVD